MICEIGAVVVVPFPFTDVPVRKRRPALVLSAEGFNRATGQSVLCMITTAAAGRWESDVPITQPESAGLKTPCVLRLKLFTLDNRLIERRLGDLAKADFRAAQSAVAAMFGVSLFMKDGDP